MRLRDDRHLRLLSDLSLAEPEAVARKFVESTVVIGWGQNVEACPTGKPLIETTANLVLRFCPRVHLIGDSEFAVSVAGMLRSVDSSSSASISAGGPLPREISASVWLGGDLAPGLPKLTTASADRWVAYISSRGDRLPSLTGSSNPFGALAAGALAAAETFKRLLPPKRGRGRLFDRVAYSVFTYRSSRDQGPALPTGIWIPGRPLLAGVGAVGQAFLHALSNVPGLQGQLTTVDHELVDDETNLNRYVLAMDTDVIARTPKTLLASAAFARNPGMRIFAEQRSLDDVLADISAGQLPRPEFVISALDNDQARYNLQLLWPDILIEGATGGTLLQVFRHAYDDGLACLRCIHTMGESVGLPYELVLSKRTGLSSERIGRAFRGDAPTLTKEDVRGLPAERQDDLARHIGKDICGLLVELGGFEANGSGRIEPAVSFTSYLAGLFAASEFVRHVSGFRPGLASRYQLDPVTSLRPAPPWAESRRKDCYCAERSAVVREYRQRMKDWAEQRTVDV